MPASPTRPWLQTSAEPDLPMSEFEWLGDARDPKATLKALRLLLQTHGVRQAVLTVRPAGTSLWRHGLALLTPGGWVLVDEAFVSGNGSDGADALNKAVKLLSRHLLRMRWTRATNGALTNDLANALGHGWLDRSQLLTIVRETGDPFTTGFDPTSHRLVIQEPPKRRSQQVADGQLSLWEGLPGLDLT